MSLNWVNIVEVDDINCHDGGDDVDDDECDSC